MVGLAGNETKAQGFRPYSVVDCSICFLVLNMIRLQTGMCDLADALEIDDAERAEVLQTLTQKQVKMQP